MSLHWRSLKAKVAAKHNYDVFAGEYYHFEDKSERV
jgi:hypothetical protein